MECFQHWRVDLMGHTEKSYDQNGLAASPSLKQSVCPYRQEDVIPY